MNEEKFSSLVVDLKDTCFQIKDHLMRNSHHIPEVRVNGGWNEYDDNSNFNELPQVEKDIAQQLDQKLNMILSKIFIFTKSSPLISEADEHDFRIYSRKIRSAIYYKKYFFHDKEIIHNEGEFIDVMQARQYEGDIIGDEAIYIIDNSYKEINRILNLINLDNQISDSSKIIEHRQSITKTRSNTAFIMMWIDANRPELNDVRDTIKQVFSSFDIKALRADEIEHEDVITKKILDEISSSDFLIADLTGERPSVYYEVGFAHAIGRRVILFRKKGTNLHFDLAMHNCPEYENLGSLKEKLTKRLEALTNKKPKKIL